MRGRVLAVTAGLGVAGIALIGWGAAATFTDTVHSTQTITAGTASAVLYSADATNGCTTAAIAEAYPSICHSVTLPDVGPVGSTFDTTPSSVFVVNDGNIKITEAAFQFSDSTNGTPGNYLQNQMYVCVGSDPGSGGSGAGGETVVANGAFTTGLGLSPSVTLIGPPLPAFGDQDEFNMEFYAGENSATCGTTWSDGGHTASAWSGASYPTQNLWVTPASLTPSAEGGSVQVTLTLTVNG